METGEVPGQWVDQVLDLLQEHLGDDSEVVVYSLYQGYERAILGIRNGHITGRKAGDSAYKSFGMEVAQGTGKGGNRYNYIVHTRDAKILRCSEMCLRNDENKVLGILAIHTNITQSIKFENHLRSYNNYPLGEMPGHTMDIFLMLEQYIQQAQSLVGKPAKDMKKTDRIAFIHYLDKLGAFLITKSSDRVCEYLGISRFTFYHYLDAVRRDISSIQE